MARIKLKLPDNFNFSTHLDVRITDINYGGHLGNDSVLAMIHEARVRLLADKGFTEYDIDGVGIMMTDSIILYASQGFYGDKLRIDVAVDEISNAGFDIYYRFVNISNEKVIVKAKTNMVFFNYTSKKVARTPEIFLNSFN
jgi:acyl-CoA thioester hydrolase